MESATTDGVAANVPARSGARLVAGTLVGMALGGVLSYLLAYASFLMAMLGLFFFVLFGVLTGAAVYRLWAPLQPVAPWKVFLGMAPVVLAGWGGSLVWEGITFPSDVAKEAIKQVEKGPSGAEVRADAEQSAREYLAERYPPGGVIGYWRWSLAEQTIEIPITGVEEPQPLRYGGNGWIFMVRVILCGAGFALAIYAVVVPLSKPLQPANLDAEAGEPSKAVNLSPPAGS